jgi:hypothetical protein
MTEKSNPMQMAAFWWQWPFAFASMARIADERAAAMVEGAVMANLEFVHQFGSLAMGRAAPMQAAQAVAVAAIKPSLKRRD